LRQRPPAGVRHTLTCLPWGASTPLSTKAQTLRMSPFRDLHLARSDLARTGLQHYPACRRRFKRSRAAGNPEYLLRKLPGGAHVLVPARRRVDVPAKGMLLVEFAPQFVDQKYAPAAASAEPMIMLPIIRREVQTDPAIAEGKRRKLRAVRNENVKSHPPPLGRLYPIPGLGGKAKRRRRCAQKRCAEKGWPGR